jgi:hypothetical protein
MNPETICSIHPSSTAELEISIISLLFLSTFLISRYSINILLRTTRTGKYPRYWDEK